MAANELGIVNWLGIEWDAAACATRAAAGHRTVRADVSQFDVSRLTAGILGLAGSPPCTQFSAAGAQAGAHLLEILAAGIVDAFAGRKTRARRRREMAHELRCSPWLADKPRPPVSAAKWRRDKQQAWKRKLLARKGSPAKLARDMAKAPPRAHLTKAQRSAQIWVAVRSASLVIEPARFIHAGHPEWVALEQVPAVLPLWEVYAAELRKRGYSAWCGRLDAACYGVPQTRVRAILIASRARTVYQPSPTHYDPRKGMQLFGEPWVSMAEALGWGMTGRPHFTLATAGGTRGGADEQVGGSGARAALYAERDAGRWELRIDAQAKATCRPTLSKQATLPVRCAGYSATTTTPTLAYGHRTNPQGHFSSATGPPGPRSPMVSSPSASRSKRLRPFSRSRPGIRGGGHARRSSGKWATQFRPCWPSTYWPWPQVSGLRS